jgi:hypothetical protein
VGKYEQTYGTNWGTLTVDQAMTRAYALGVAASLGEYHPDELEAIRNEMGSAYERSVVDLAFEEGKNEGREHDGESNGGERTWNELVEDEPVTIEPEEIPTGGRTGLPEAVDRMEALERPTPDKNEAVDLPSFLEKD